MYYQFGGPGPVYDFFGFIMMLIFLGFLFALGMFVLKRMNHHNGPNPSSGSWHGSNALSILDERLARGEIDIDEYNAKKEVLKREQ